MTWLTNKRTNSLFIAGLSLIYGTLFLLISGHMEFLSILPKRNSANMGLWNAWLNVLYDGGLTYVGYGIFFLAFLIVLMTFSSRAKKFDEYQGSILTKVIFMAGLVVALFSPLVIVNILSEPHFAVPFILFGLTVLWSFIVVTYLFFLVRFGR